MSTVADDETRPLLVLDESEDVANVFVTKPADPNLRTDGQLSDEVLTLTVPRRIRPAGTTAVVLDIEASRATADAAVSACTWRRWSCLATPHVYVSTAAAASNRIVLPLRRDGGVTLAADTGKFLVTVDAVGAHRRG